MSENGLASKNVENTEKILPSDEKNNVVKARMILEDLAALAQTSESVSPDEVHFSICRALNGTASDVDGTIFELEKEKDLTIQTPKLYVTPRNKSQKNFVQAIMDHDISFGIGPAGTGKTYLSVAFALAALVANEVDRIILCRPAVEAGESLGFLPGDLKEKVDPYLRPLYDALYDMMPSQKFDRMLASGEIEIAPLAFMRGRTLTNAFVIIDEAQNTTPVQMKMVLTRLGEDSRMIITGDLSQIDLPSGQLSGLSDAVNRLEMVKGIGIIRLSAKDVVRHPVVARILKAYETRQN